MKKLSILCILLLFILSGCSSENASGDISENDLKKAQVIAICDANGSVIQTISDEDAIDAFVTALDIDHWAPADSPADADILGSIGFSQEKAIHLGETDNDGKLYNLARLTIYTTPVAEITLLGFDLAFALPDAAYKTLTNYLQ